MRRFLIWIKKIFAKLVWFFTRESCYAQMENAGVAVFGMCSGVVGGSSNTQFLADMCCDCKHYVSHSFPKPTDKKGDI